MAIHGGRGVERVVRAAERFVDLREAIGHLRHVLRAQERLDRTGDEIGRRLGPCLIDRGFTGRKAADRALHRLDDVGERRVLTFAEASLEPLHRARELRLTREPRRALQRVDRAPRGFERLVVALAGVLLERHEMALQLHREEASELRIARRHAASVSSSL